MDTTRLGDVCLKTDVKMAGLYSLFLSFFCFFVMTIGFLLMNFSLTEAVIFSFFFGFFCFAALVFHFLNRSSIRIQHSSGTILIESFRNSRNSCIEISEQDSFKCKKFGIVFYPQKRPEIYVFISNKDREIIMNLLKRVEGS